MILYALIVVVSLVAITYQNHLHAKERQTLLDRIQAPEAVISERISQDAPMLRAVDQFDDEDHWAAKKEQR